VGLDDLDDTGLEGHYPRICNAWREWMSRVLIVCNDVIGERMAGPAIRSWEIAKALSHEHQVTLLARNQPTVKAPDSRFVLAMRTPRVFARLVRDSEVVISQGSVMPIFYALWFNKCLVVDLYDPFPIADLEDSRFFPSKKRHRHHRLLNQNIAVQLWGGDFFLCASDTQRNFWIGMLQGAGRITPEVYDNDTTLRSLIEVVPFGIPVERPAHTRSVLKGVYPGIRAQDRVLLWGGGIWNWFDPVTLLQSMARLRDSRPEIKLLFMGVAHPNLMVDNLRMAEAAISLSRELDLYDRTVFFHQEWVPYAERQNYLLEADIGVSTNLDHLEAQLAFRTRLLDCIWAGLPIICTGGDTMAALVEKEGLGLTVPPNDVDGLTSAILRLFDDKDYYRTCKDNLTKVAERFHWDTVVEPLQRFCANPSQARDKTPALRRRAILASISYYLSVLRFQVAEKGIGNTIQQIIGHSQRVARY